MGHWLSRGIRIYEHDHFGDLSARDNYNYYQGMNELRDLLMDPTFRLVAVGSESGAMVAHFQWTR